MITFTFRLKQENVSQNSLGNFEKLDLEKLKASTDHLDWVTGDENVDLAKIKWNLNERQDAFLPLERKSKRKSDW